MQIKFNTQGPMDFANDRYVLVFNTSGQGGEPYAVYGNQASGYPNYSFAIVVSGSGGSVAQAIPVEYYHQTTVGGATNVTQIQLPFTQQQLQLLPNSNGQGTQFIVTFQRNLFNGVNVTPAPSPSPSGTPSAPPPPAASSSPSASPSPAPNPGPTTTAQSTWYINFFVLDSNGNILDAPGINGAQDTTFQFPVNVSTVFDQQFNVALPGSAQAPTPASQITIGEVSNTP